MLNKRDVLEKHFGTRDWAEIEKLWLEQDTSSYVTLPPKSLPLPYSLPANELPAPIPTVEEISKQANTENDLTGKTSLVNCQVYKVNGYAVKFAGTPKLLQVSQFLSVFLRTGHMLKKIGYRKQRITCLFSRTPQFAYQSCTECSLGPPTLVVSDLTRFIDIGVSNAVHRDTLRPTRAAHILLPRYGIY